MLYTAFNFSPLSAAKNSGSRLAKATSAFPANTCFTAAPPPAPGTKENSRPASRNQPCSWAAKTLVCSDNGWLQQAIRKGVAAVTWRHGTAATAAASAPERRNQRRDLRGGSVTLA